MERYRMLLVTAVVVLSSCTGNDAFSGLGPNDTGLVACEFATASMWPPHAQAQKRLFGDGSVASRRKLQESFMNCHDAILEHDDE